MLRQLPMGETESGGLAMQAPELLRTIMLGSIGTLAKGLKGKFPTAVVSVEGEPKLLYHGTHSAFGEYDPSKATPGLYGKGIYLTDDPSVAKGYADLGLPYGRPDVAALSGPPQGTYSPNIRPAFVRIQKPFDIEAPVDPALVSWIKKQRYTHPERRLANGQDVYDVLGQEGLKKAGYDGITHIGGKISGGKPHRVYIAFDPKQVVSPFDPQLQSLAGETRQLLENRLKQE